MSSAPEPFADVSPPLRIALERRGFTELTPVQSATLGCLANSETPVNLRISSQTGSGKTVALGLVLARTLLDEPSPAPGPHGLIIAPTRELAVQVRDELSWLFAGLDSVSVDVVTGGTDVRGEARRLTRPPRVLVGTPGRLLDHLRSGALRFDEVSQVVLDEADQMLQMGFKDELDAIVDQLPSTRRSHLVSATFPPAVLQLAARFQRDAVTIEGTALGRPNADIEHLGYLFHPKELYASIANLLLSQPTARSLLFVRTRADTFDLATRLARDGFSALPFSGELSQEQRNRALASFKSGAVTVLVATDVAARGIDIPGIETVLHVDLPRDPDAYTHRSGRTGRAGQQGRSLILVPARQQGRLHRLLRPTGVEVKWRPIPTPKKIRQAATKAMRRSLYERLEGAQVDEGELEYARGLLEKRPAEELVSLLLRMAEPPLPCEPFEVHPVEIRAPSGDGSGDAASNRPPPHRRGPPGRDERRHGKSRAGRRPGVGRSRSW